MFDTEIEIQLNALSPKNFEFNLYDKNDRTKILEFLNGEMKNNDVVIPYNYNEDNCVYLTEKLADYLKHKGSRRSIEDFRKIVNKSKNKKLKNKISELDKVIDFMDSDYVNYTRYNQDRNRPEKRRKITKYNSSTNFFNNSINLTNNSILSDENSTRIEEENKINESIYYNKIINPIVSRCGFSESNLPQNLFYSIATIGLITEQLLNNLKGILEKGDGELLSNYILELSHKLVKEAEEKNFNEDEKKIIENIKTEASVYLDNYLDERMWLFIKYFNTYSIEEKIDIFEKLILIRFREITDLDIKINSIITEKEIKRTKEPSKKEKLIELDKKTKNFKFIPSFTPTSDGIEKIINYMKLINKKEYLNGYINYIIEKIERNFNKISVANPKYNIIEDLSTMDYLNNKEEFKEKLTKLAPLSNWRFFIDSEFYKTIKQPFMLENLGICVLKKIAEKLKKIDEIEYNIKKNKLENSTITSEIKDNIKIGGNKEICNLVAFEQVLSDASEEMEDLVFIENMRKSRSLDFM